jgi:hypothetical protein
MVTSIATKRNLDRPTDGACSELSIAAIEGYQRDCEQWFWQHADKFEQLPGKYIAISYFLTEELEYSVAPTLLEAVQCFEKRYGTDGCYVRRIGDPQLVF